MVDGGTLMGARKERARDREKLKVILGFKILEIAPWEWQMVTLRIPFLAFLTSLMKCLATTVCSRFTAHFLPSIVASYTSPNPPLPIALSSLQLSVADASRERGYVLRGAGNSDCVLVVPEICTERIVRGVRY